MQQDNAPIDIDFKKIIGKLYKFTNKKPIYNKKN